MDAAGRPSGYVTSQPSRFILVISRRVDAVTRNQYPVLRFITVATSEKETSSAYSRGLLAYWPSSWKAMAIN